MRVVIAPFNRMSDSTLAEVRRAGHDVVCTGSPSLEYSSIAAQYPAGWEPDVFILWSPEYHPIPRDLELAPCFKVGVFGDWNLGGQAMQQMAGAFDLLIADSNGAEKLRSMGFANAVSAPLWSFDPDLHRRLPGVERDIDILLIGNFNHDIQHERVRWLARVARLSSRCSVCLTGGVHGQAYTELMNRAKIVFNRSIRGEINMRAYEAPACGALLFYERENQEIRSLYRDREECVLYGDDDLEALLDFYLANDAERQAVADAGYRRVQRETPARHVAQIFEVIERELTAHSRDRTPPLAAMSPRDREVRRVRQWLLSSEVTCLGAADGLLRDTDKDGADPALTARLQGYLFAQAGKYLPGIDQDSAWTAARDLWRESIRIDPVCIAGRLNLAALMLQTGRPAEAEAQLREVYSALLAPDASVGAPGELFWPCRFSPFGVEYDRIEAAFVQGSPRWTEAMRNLLRWRTCELLTDIAYASARYPEAERFACEACGAIPRMPATHLRYAGALHALGKTEAAVREYRTALDGNPFMEEARNALAQLLTETGQPADALALLDDWSSIIAGCPEYRPCLQECERLQALARQALNCPTSAQNIHPRLLAFPNWDVASDWQATIEAFTERARSGPALLMLWAGGHGVRPAELLRRIGAHLTAVLNVLPSEFPNITILAEPLEPRDRWKIFHVADAVLVRGDIPKEFEDVFDASGLPALSISDMRRQAA